MNQNKISEVKIKIRKERNVLLKKAYELVVSGVVVSDPERLDIRGTLTCGKNVKIDINCVLSVLNCFDLYKLFNYFDDNDISIFVDLLVPEDKFISVKFLSKELKEKLIYEYSSYNSDRINLNDAINFLKKDIDLESNDDSNKNMLREILLFDKSRDQTYKNYLSKEIINFLNYG